MLRELRIRDVAIIDDLALSFGPGLNVITGETGAGKSIILQSLAMLCGGRANADLIRGEADTAAVEGLFDVALPAEVRDALALDGDDEVLVRRQLTRAGKGRIQVNGGPITQALLGQLGEHLVHVYGQHEQARLLRPASHRELLDEYGNVGDAARQVAETYSAFVTARRRRDDHAARAAALLERRDLLEFQQRELADIAPRADEDGTLHDERELLRHAERLQSTCRDGEVALYSGNSAMVGGLARLHTQLTDLTAIAPLLGPIAELVENSRVQLEEAALQLRAAGARLEADPQRLDAIEERMASLQRLARKYGVEVTQLADALATVERDLATLTTQAIDAADAEAELAALRATALTAARKLSKLRRAAAKRLATAMVGELASLGMQSAVLEVVITDDDAALSADGIDQVEFFLSANPGEPPKPLTRVASGGELSRILLALKALTASLGETPILIFDEVDAGIGGTVADAVARRLRTLADNRQLLCITHLPQIAAYADQHFAVEKGLADGRTLTRARVLDANARIAEVSRMLGGGSASAEAERYAKRLIAEARRSG